MIKFNKTFCFILFLFSGFVLLYLSSHIHRTFNNIIDYHSECYLSRIESDDFFCETNDDWQRRKQIFQLQHKRNRFHNEPYFFFQYNHEPTFSCRFEQRLGNNGDGGKWICDVYRLKQSKPCLIYSLGSFGDFSFENETKHYLPHCDIHTFDMRAFNCTEVCTFHQVRVGNGTNNTKTLGMLMTDLNHQGRHLEILKIDVEGSEYEFFNELFGINNCLSENIRQILVEIHMGPIMHKVNSTTTYYDYNRLHRLFELFHQKNFVMFHKEVNLFSPWQVFEFSFIRMNKKFFQYDDHSNSTNYRR